MTMNKMTSKTWDKRKALITALLAAILVIGTGIYTSPVFAADSFTLTGNYESVDLDQYKLDPSSSTTITLYRVGTISGTKLNLNEVVVPFMGDLMENGTLKGWGTKSEDYSDEEAWQKAWLDRAAAIEDMINAHGLQDNPNLKVGSVDVNLGQGSTGFSFSGLTPGLYLVTGTGQELETYKGINVKGTKSYVKPVPMLVQVINNTNITLKPEVQGPVDKIIVMKTWAGDSAADRPASIEVKLTYKEPGEEGGTFETTLELTADNNWVAEYDTGDRVDPTRWSIAEATLLPGYTISQTSGPAVNGVLKVTFTNTHNPPPPPVTSKTLEIAKKVPTYVEHSKNVSTVFIFEVSGYVGNTRVLHRFVSVSFDAAGEKTLHLGDIPDGMSRVVVKEVDSSNYTVSGDAEKTATLSGTTYSVTFENTYDNTTVFEGGVINKYKQSGSGYKFDSREGHVRK